jgi:ketosteroid isomerase-like protein
MIGAQLEQQSVSATAKGIFQAFADHDRAAIEALVADDFRFTSPLDNGLDRKTYFERCWPNNEQLAAFEFVRVVENGAEAVVTYEARTTDNRKFRNTEILTVREGQVSAVEVYFGWSIPHEAPAGGFVNKA